MGDLFASQTTDRGVNPAQLSALSPKTRLVTLGFGGNDIGFSSLMKTCVSAGLGYQLESCFDGDVDDAPCRARYVSAGTDDVTSRIKVAGGRLAVALSDVRRRAPEARGYGVGYQAILPAQGNHCDRAMGLAPGDVGFLRENEQQLNAMLRDRAKAVGAGYVDTCTPSVGRDACADRAVRWIEPLIPQASAASVRPNERGERGMARVVLDVMKAPRAAD